jgi:hypothetical protein
MELKWVKGHREMVEERMDAVEEGLKAIHTMSDYDKNKLLERYNRVVTELDMCVFLLKQAQMIQGEKKVMEEILESEE